MLHASCLSCCQPCCENIYYVWGGSNLKGRKEEKKRNVLVNSQILGGKSIMIMMTNSQELFSLRKEEKEGQGD